MFTFIVKYQHLKISYHDKKRYVKNFVEVKNWSMTMDKKFEQ